MRKRAAEWAAGRVFGLRGGRSLKREVFCRRGFSPDAFLSDRSAVAELSRQIEAMQRSEKKHRG
ncbi:hypothetical protein [Lysobacter gummosus]|uniref:hypothetical protein n=1 Tax=Lysobacter gummosus TaxID=262324 RepID=UPI003636B75C